MGCETCKNDMTEEAKAVRAAQDMAQKYKLLCRAVAALVVGFVVMAGCMVWAVTNAQTIANEAVLKALETVAEKMDCSVSGLQKQEYAALDRCAEAWENLAFAQDILKAAQ